jgi:hypothetical protein
VESIPNLCREYFDSLGVNATERQAIQDAMVEFGAIDWVLVANSLTFSRRMPYIIGLV